MSLVARVVRQVTQGEEVVTLERIVVVPSPLTTGHRLDLRAEGVELPIPIVSLTVWSNGDGPGRPTPDADVFLAPELLAAGTRPRGRLAGLRAGVAPDENRPDERPGRPRTRTYG